MRIARHWEKIALVGGLMVLVLAFSALRALLHEVRPADVFRAFAHLHPWRWGLAVLFTAGSFACLSLYDFLALRTIGSGVPFRIAARAAATAYAIANLLGLPVLTGGSVRLRIYSKAGLTAPDVARVMALASATFWGGILVLFGVVAFVSSPPMRVGAFVLPAWVQYGIGVVIAGAVAAYFVRMRHGGRQLSLGPFSIALPAPKIAGAQLVVAAADLACAAAVLFILIPHLHPSRFPLVLGAYVLALVVAVLTHAPGGLGVFEAMILVMLPEIDHGRLAAALIGYRLIYYVLPFAVAAITLVVTEGAALRRHVGPVVRGGRAVATSIAPPLMGMLVFAAGALLLITGAFPATPGTLGALTRWLPLLVIEFSHLVASLIGTVLLFTAYGLYRRLDIAYVVGCGLLGVGVIAAVARGYDYAEAATLTSILLLLLWTRPAFYRYSALTSEQPTAGWLVAIATVMLTSIYVGAFVYKHVDYRNELWWHVSVAGDAPRYLRASLVSAITAAGLAIWRLALPRQRILVEETLPAEVWERAVAHTSASEAHLARTGDKRFLTSTQGDAFLMYQIRGRSWITMGDPIGPPERWKELVWALRDRADRHQGRVVFYECSAALLPLAIDLGLGLMKLGEFARVPLATFSLDGSHRRGMRQVLKRMERLDVHFSILEGAELAAVLPKLRAVSDAWLWDKRQSEKQFSLGRFDPAYLQAAPVAVVRQGTRIVAFANVWPLPNKAEVSIDLMRHVPDAPNGIMDFLFTNLLIWARDAGYARFSLGMAPLSGIESRRLAPLWARLAGTLYRHGERLYGYEGLRRYKDKFGPEWTGRYLAAPKGVSMAKALIDVTLLISSPARRRSATTSG